MEKNMGEQLNKAYEAFRKASMDRDNARNQLQQKTEHYEQRISDLQQEMTLQKRLIVQLNSKLSGCACADSGSTYGKAHVLLHEESETRRSDEPLDLTSEPLQEQLKLAIQAEKDVREQLEVERSKLKRFEEDRVLRGKTFESVLNSKDEQIVLLKQKLKEANERLEKLDCKNMQMCETEVHNKRRDCPAGQDIIPVSSVISAIQVTDREAVEKIFQEMKEEFHHICKLTQEQTHHLHKFNARKEAATEAQFSMPIQCTDAADEQAEGLFKPPVKKEANKGALITSITSRGLNLDEEDDCSVESLSQFSIKFPPTDNDSVFLQSTPEKTVVSSPVATENPFQDKCNLQIDDHALNLIEPCYRSLEVHGNAPRTPVIENNTYVDKVASPHHLNAFKQSTQDKTPPLTAEEHVAKFKFPLHEAPEGNSCPLEPPSRAIRGPQQIYWKPNNDQDNDVRQVQGYADSELNNSAVCEFCQAVFPPSTTHREDFFRHLNSHFNEKV